MDYISQANVGGTTYAVGLPNVYINSKGNLNIETSAEIGNTPAEKGKINIESNSDIQLKPGDDITLYSHHREEGKQNEVALKILNGEEKTEYPVQLQINASDIVLTTKDKTGDNANVMDVAINTGQKDSNDKPIRGYLKLRAQAIDLRSETHGGIALQPKGYDSDSHMNKIKFEHGGGDGLEFGTFNTEKTSIFTDEYRFNKDGVWKMATRVTEASNKPDANDATTALKYVKQADDFYDVIAQDDVTATTKDIIKTANALNGTERIHTKITSKGNLELASLNGWSYATESLGVASGDTASLTRATQVLIVKKAAIDSATNDTCISVTIDGSVSKLLPGVTAGSWSGVTVTDLTSSGYYAFDFSEYDTEVTTITVSYPQGPYMSAFIVPKALYEDTYYYDAPSIEANTVYSLSDVVSSFNLSSANASTLEDKFKDVNTVELLANFTEAPTKYTFTKTEAASINIEGDGDVKLKSGGEVSINGIKTNGDYLNFGELEDALIFNDKYTKQGNAKQCDTIRIVATNNNNSSHSFNTLWDTTLNSGAGGSVSETTVSLAKGESQVIAQCSVYDIIKLVNYFKSGSGQESGPWATPAVSS